MYIHIIYTVLLFYLTSHLSFKKYVKVINITFFFIEARTHGVGYYALSGDEAIRVKQQAELKRLHEETERERVAASEARAKREHALQLRVRAARARQRARAGLPPEEEEPGM